MHSVSGDILVYAQSTASTVHGGPRWGAEFPCYCDHNHEI